MITGSIVALVTPMFEDGSLDWESLDSLLDFHLENGTNGIVAVGTTGESATLDPAEHCKVIEHVVKKIAGRIDGALEVYKAEERTLSRGDKISFRRRTSFTDEHKQEKNTSIVTESEPRVPRARGSRSAWARRGCRWGSRSSARAAAMPRCWRWVRPITR